MRLVFGGILMAVSTIMAVSTVAGLWAAGTSARAQGPNTVQAGADAQAQSAPGEPPYMVKPGDTVPLKGGVRGTALPTEEGLKKIGETARQLKQTSLVMMHEVTRREMVAVRSPNVLPGGIVIQPMPNSTGMAPGDVMPPRKKQLEVQMREIEYQVKLLRNEIDALIIPESKASAVQEPWGRIRAAMSQIVEHYNNLTALVTVSRPDSLKIGREAVAIHDLTAQIEKLRREVMKTVFNG